MKGKTAIAALALAVTLAPMALAQSAQNQQRSKDLAGSQLIAWSQAQHAQPMPATQARSTPTGAPQENAQKQPASQAFTGTIMRSGDTYVLKTSDNVTYQLDDQARAKQFEGKQVQVVGSLDANSNTIKVQDIKQAS